jgi:hypothetical protein
MILDLLLDHFPGPTLTHLLNRVEQRGRQGAPPGVRPDSGPQEVGRDAG